MAGAFAGWSLHSSLLMIVGVIATLILSLVIIFKPHTASYLSQPYAVIEGLLLGSISSYKYCISFGHFGGMMDFITS